MPRHAAPSASAHAASDRDRDGSAVKDVVRHEDGVAVAGADHVAREEPLEIQLGAAALAVVMRTPGHDEELACGFLVTERVVDDPSQIVSVRHCRQARDPASAENVVRVVLGDGVRVDLEALRRNLYASSSCGICGKATLENALASAPALDDSSRFAPDFFYALPDRLAREDIGRHNAVDKVVGFALRAGLLPLSGHVLLVSGRISYEIAQKALAARIPVVAAVSAPSSLAVELAMRARMTLVAFLRGRSMNVFGERGRVRSPS
jgi:FdhD protein